MRMRCPTAEQRGIPKGVVRIRRRRINPSSTSGELDLFSIALLKWVKGEPFGRIGF